MLSRNERYQERSPIHVNDTGKGVGVASAKSVGIAVGVKMAWAGSSVTVVGVTVKGISSAVGNEVAVSITGTTGKGSRMPVKAGVVVSTDPACVQDTNTMMIRKERKIEGIFILLTPAVNFRHNPTMVGYKDFAIDRRHADEN